MTPIRWLPGAVDDLRRLHDFLTPHSLDAANRAISTLLDASETLMSFPEKGKPLEFALNYRELPVRFGSRGYVIRYRLHRNEVLIVRVWHALENR